MPVWQVLIGLYSVHNNGNEDRMWKLRCGRTCAPLNCQYKVIDGDWSKDTSRQGDVYKYSVSESEHDSRERTDAQKEKTTNSLMTAKMDAKASVDWISSSASTSASAEVKNWSNELTNQWKEVTKNSRTLTTKYSFTRAPPSTVHVFTWKLRLQFTGGNPKCVKNMWITPGNPTPYTVYSTSGDKPKCLGGKCQNGQCTQCMGDQWMFKEAKKSRDSAEFLANMDKLAKMEEWLKKRGRKCEDNVHCKALLAKLG